MRAEVPGTGADAEALSVQILSWAFRPELLVAQSLHAGRVFGFVGYYCVRRRRPGHKFHDRLSALLVFGLFVRPFRHMGALLEGAVFCESPIAALWYCGSSTLLHAQPGERFPPGPS